jgi:hypothetical protein
MMHSTSSRIDQSNMDWLPTAAWMLLSVSVVWFPQQYSAAQQQQYNGNRLKMQGSRRRVVVTDFANDSPFIGAWLAPAST